MPSLKSSSHSTVIGRASIANSFPLNQTIHRHLLRIVLGGTHEILFASWLGPRKCQIIWIFIVFNLRRPGCLDIIRLGLRRLDNSGDNNNYQCCQTEIGNSGDNNINAVRLRLRILVPIISVQTPNSPPTY